MTTHAVIITYLRDQTQPAVDAIGGFYRTCVLTGKALVRRPFHWREAIEQAGSLPASRCCQPWRCRFR